MSAPPVTILVIEDERPIRRILRPAIEAAGWSLIEAETGTAGILEASQGRPDAIILDLGLPDMEGIEVIRRIRDWSHVPILILSARGQERDKVAALDAGADDYIQKPFSVVELMARLRVALRHTNEVQQDDGENTITAGDIVIDLARRCVTKAGKEIHFTPIEYKLLSVLARHADRVLTQQQLLKEIWGPGYSDQPHYLRIFVRQLRQKLEENPANPQHLLTEVGVGYRFRVSAS